MAKRLDVYTWCYQFWVYVINNVTPEHILLYGRYSVPWHIVRRRRSIESSSEFSHLATIIYYYARMCIVRILL